MWKSAPLFYSKEPSICNKFYIFIHVSSVDEKIPSSIFAPGLNLFEDYSPRYHFINQSCRIKRVSRQKKQQQQFESTVCFDLQYLIRCYATTRLLAGWKLEPFHLVVGREDRRTVEMTYCDRLQSSELKCSAVTNWYYLLFTAKCLLRVVYLP